MGRLIFICFIFSSCVNQMKDINSIYSENIVHDFGNNIAINYYLEGKLEFSIKAPKLEIIKNPDPKNIFSDGIYICVYNRDLDTIATISSDFALQDKSVDIVEARKNVVLKNNQQHHLNTETLFWNKKTKEIYTDDFITLSTKDQIIMGFGFVSDQNFSTYTISNITGTLYL